MKKQSAPPATLLNPDIEDIEITLLAQAIYRCSGYDFRNYAPTSLKRRLRRIVAMEAVTSISALQERALRDPVCMQRIVEQITVNVTSMFRDPGFFRAFRSVAVPLLKEHSSLRIWHAGCAGGEEVYSMAIVLHEEGLLERSRVYATDINRTALQAAQARIFPLGKMREYTRNYQASGGKAAFSDYYQSGHGNAVMRADLSRSITWAQHNLVTDASFNEFHLILCRNVMIYFDMGLQERVHRLLYDSLASDSLLMLGRQESLQMTPHEFRYQALDRAEKIYRRAG